MNKHARNPLPPLRKTHFLLLLDRSTRLLLGQGCSSEIWLDDLEVGEERLGLIILHAGVHDNIIAYCTILSLRNSKKDRKKGKFKLTRHPVDGRGNSVLVPSLQRVDHTQHFGRIPPCRSRIGKNQTDGLLRINDENAPDGKGNPLRVDIGRILIIQHVICIRNLTRLVGNDRECQFASRNLVNVLDPAAMSLDRVGRQTNQFDSAFCELGLEFGKGA